MPACYSASSFPDDYDRSIRQAAKRYLPGVDWRLLKAQYYQESRLDPAAISPMGAAGVAQFMPGTWGDVSRSLGYEGVSPHMAGPAIEAGAFYMARLRRSWHSPRPESDRHSLALASYNAGFGHLLKAQQQCGGGALYSEISPCLPDITGHNAKETLIYVQRIWRYWTAMVLGL